VVACAPLSAPARLVPASADDTGIASAVFIALCALSSVALGLVAVFVLPVTIRFARTGHALQGYADALAPLQPLLRDRDLADAQRLEIILRRIRKTVQVLHQLLRVATVGVLIRSLPLENVSWAKMRRPRLPRRAR